MGRRAALKLLYQSVDVSRDIAPFVRSVTFQDNVGKADDLQVELCDASRLWKTDWFPSKGDSLEASLMLTDWASEGDGQELYCGVFFVDEITAQGPEEMVTVKASSVPVASSVRYQRKTRAMRRVLIWLENCGGEISGEMNGLVIPSMAVSVAFSGRYPLP